MKSTQIFLTGAAVLIFSIDVSSQVQSAGRPVDLFRRSVPATSAFTATLNSIQASDKKITFFTSIETEDLPFDVRDKDFTSVPVRDWPDAICTEDPFAKFGSPRNFPVALLRFSRDEAIEFAQALALNKGRLCGGNIETQTYPIGTITLSVISTLNNRLPDWTSVDDIMAATLRPFPDSNEWSFDRSFRVSDPLCEVDSVQPEESEVETALAKLDSSSCVIRDSMGELRIGSWYRKRLYYNVSAHSAAPRRQKRRIYYSNFEKDNSITDWNQIDNGFKNSQIEVLVAKNFSIKKTSDRTNFEKLAKTLCTGWSHWGEIDERIRSAVLRDACRWRATNVRLLDAVPANLSSSSTLLLYLSDYIRDINTRFKARRAFVDAWAAQALAEDGNSLVVMAGGRPATNSSYLSGVAGAYPTVGWTVWVAYPTYVTRHPKFQKWLDEIKKGPLANGYRGSIAFYSDIETARLQAQSLEK